MPEAKEINITNSEWIIMKYLWEKAPKTVDEKTGYLCFRYDIENLGRIYQTFDGGVT